MMRKFLIAVLAFASVLAQAQTPPIQPQTPQVKLQPAIDLPGPKAGQIGAEPLTLDEAIAVALKNQPLIGIAKGALRSAAGQTRQAESAELLQLTGASAYGSSRNLQGGPVTGNPIALSANVTVSQLLFDFGRTRDAVRQQSAVQRAVQYTLNRTVQTVTLSVQTGYYSLVQARQAVDIAQANLTARQRQLDLAQARLDSGLGAPSDVVNARANLADGVISLSSARDAATTAQILLAQALGIDPRTPLNLSENQMAASQPADDMTALVDTALKQRPDVLAAQNRVVAASAGVAQASKGNLPKFTLSAIAGASGANNISDVQTGTLILNVTCTFFDSGLTSGKIQDAKGSEDSAKQTLISISQQVVADVSQAWIDLKTALQRVEAAETQVANAQEYVRMAEGRYAGGLGQFLDVVTAQTTLNSAQNNLNSAHGDAARAQARLQAAIGR